MTAVGGEARKPAVLYAHSDARQAVSGSADLVDLVRRACMPTGRSRPLVFDMEVIVRPQ